MTHLSLGRSRAPRLNALAIGVLVAFGATGVGAGASVPTAANQLNAARSNHALVGARAPNLIPGTHNRAHHPKARKPAAARSPDGNLLVVSNCDDSGSGSLRDVLAGAASGDVVDMSGLACSTITLTSGPVSTYYDVSLLGPGRDALTINGNAAGQVIDGYGTSLSIEGLTIANGSSNYGGCINASGDLTLTDSTVTGCSGGDGTNYYSYGGGVDVLGNLTLVSSAITDNTATASNDVYGGGAYVYGTFVAESGSTVSGNTATSTSNKARGGGIFAQGIASLYSGSVVSDNSVQSTYGNAYGGGIDSNGPIVQVISSTVSGNTAHSENSWAYGGGIQTGDYSPAATGSIYLYDSTLSGNTVSSNSNTYFAYSSRGGGSHSQGYTDILYSSVFGNAVVLGPSSNGHAVGGGLSAAEFVSGNDSSINLLDSTISGNTASGGSFSESGGAYTATGDVTAYNSTVAFNSAGTYGGGIQLNYSYGATFFSTIVSNNIAAYGADVGSFANITISGDHNLIMATTSNVTVPSDTLTSDPNLQPLAANGGPTLTHALISCSAAVNTGSNVSDAAYDQRGAPFVREFDGAPDIGAFELQPNPDVIFSDGFEGAPVCP